MSAVAAIAAPRAPHPPTVLAGGSAPVSGGADDAFDILLGAGADDIGANAPASPAGGANTPASAPGGAGPASASAGEASTTAPRKGGVGATVVSPPTDPALIAASLLAAQPAFAPAATALAGGASLPDPAAPGAGATAAPSAASAASAASVAPGAAAFADAADDTDSGDHGGSSPALSPPAVSVDPAELAAVSLPTTPGGAVDPASASTPPVARPSPQDRLEAPSSQAMATGQLAPSALASPVEGFASAMQSAGVSVQAEGGGAPVSSAATPPAASPPVAVDPPAPALASQAVAAGPSQPGWSTSAPPTGPARGTKAPAASASAPVLRAGGPSASGPALTGQDLRAWRIAQPPVAHVAIPIATDSAFEAQSQDASSDGSSADDGASGDEGSADVAGGALAPTALAVAAGASGAMQGAAASPLSATTADLAAQMAAKLAAGGSRFQLQLNPNGLGQVNVQVTVGPDKALRAQLSFDDPAVAGALRAHAAELQGALQQAGFNVPANGLQFSAPSHAFGAMAGGGSGHHGGGASGQGFGANAGANRGASSFAANDAGAGPAPAYGGMADSQLDIRI